MRINTNVASLNTQRILGQTSAEASKIMGRLSSGFRINHASDDAAGLGIANKLRNSLRSMQQASRNADQATSVLQIAEGATQTISSILDRMKELATQAASDNSDDSARASIKAEFGQLKTEIGKIASTTKYQNNTLINGAFGTSLDTTNSTALAAGKMVYSASLNGAAADTYTISDQTGSGNQLKLTNGAGVSQTVSLSADGKQSVSFDAFGVTLDLDASFKRNSDGSSTNTQAINSTTIKVAAGSNGGSFLVRSSGAYTSDDLITLDKIDLTTSTLGLDGITLTSNGTASEWQGAMTAIDSAVGKVNTALGGIGAAQNRISFASQNVKTTIENVAAAESTIRDADMAEEMSNFTKTQILQQAGTAMLAQANSAPQLVLKLLG